MASAVNNYTDYKEWQIIDFNEEDSASAVWDNGYVNWETAASRKKPGKGEHRERKVHVRHGPWKKFLIGSLPAGKIFTEAVRNLPNAEVVHGWFTFEAIGEEISTVYWDPVISFGQDERVAYDDSDRRFEGMLPAWGIALIVLGIIGLLGVVGLVAFFLIRLRNQTVYNKVTEGEEYMVATKTVDEGATGAYQS